MHSYARIYFINTYLTFPERLNAKFEKKAHAPISHSLCPPVLSRQKINSISYYLRNICVRIDRTHEKVKSFQSFVGIGILIIIERRVKLDEKLNA